MNGETAARKRLVLVTGAGGFLGANIVWALREHGFAVRAFVHRPPRGPQWLDLDGVEFTIGDIRNSVQVRRAVEGVGAVVHVAAVTRLIPRPRRLAFDVNVEGTRALCAAALQAGVRRFVFTSSAASIAPGTAEHPGDEDFPDNRDLIRAPYCTTKRRAERIVRAFSACGLETIALCPAYVLGPRDSRPTTNELLLGVARYPWLPLPPGGMNVTDVREVALAHVRALWLGEPGGRYLLAGPYRTYADVADVVRRILGRRGGGGVLPRWAAVAGSIPLAIAAGVWPGMPNGLSVPSFQYGFVSYHLTGARADRTFGLTHRPPEQTVLDALRWFRDTGLAQWLPAAFHSPFRAPSECTRVHC